MNLPSICMGRLVCDRYRTSSIVETQQLQYWNSGKNNRLPFFLSCCLMFFGWFDFLYDRSRSSAYTVNSSKQFSAPETGRNLLDNFCGFKCRLLSSREAGVAEIGVIRTADYETSLWICKQNWLTCLWTERRCKTSGNTTFCSMGREGDTVGHTVWGAKR